MKRQLSFVAVAFLILTTAISVYAIYDQIATGTWGPAGALAESRNGAAAVRLDDGRVLFVGGSGANGSLSSAEALTAGAGFSSVAPMSEARKGHTATKLQDGRVLVVGGDNGSGATLTAEIYDPSSDSWSHAGNLATARSGHTASLLQDGRVLIAGGANSGGPVSSLEVFDPAANTFSSAGTLQTGRSGHAAAVLQSGRILITGGTGVGQDGNPVTLNSVEIYDPETESVSSGASLGSARAGHSATTLLDGKVLVMGGNDGAQDLASAEIYDAAVDTWTATSSAASTRSGHAAFLLPNNNNVLIVGGSSAGSDLASAQLYEPWSGNFKSTGAMAATHSGIAGAAVGAEGFVAAAGGTTGEVYHFATIKTDAADYPPGTQVNISGSGWKPGETVSLTLVESPLFDTHGPYNVVADASGNIADGSFTTDAHDVNIQFTLTAVGSESQAQSVFTDAAGDNTTALISCSPNPVTAGSATTCTATVNNTQAGAPNGFPQGTATFSFNGPAGTFTFSPSDTCTLARIGSSNSSSCTVSLTPNSAGSGNVKFNFNSADPNLWKNDVSPNFALTVNPNPASKYLVTASNNSPIAGSTITITAQLANAANNPVAIAGKVVTWSKTGINGSFGSPTSTTNASGIATVSFTTDTVSGRTYTFTATDNSSPINLTGTSGNVTTVAGPATKYAVTSSDNNPVAGSAVTISAQLEDTNGNAVSTAGRTVNWTNTGTGASFSPSASSLTNASGIATVTFTTAPTPGTYTVTATDTLGATGTTGNITTKVGPPAKLAFAQQPTDAIVSAVIAPAVTVQLQDANGNLTSISGTPITVSILNNPGAGTLAGTLTVNTASGTATFSDLSINNAGVGYTLKAHSVGVTDATSAAFNINKKDQTITFGALGNKTYGDADFNVSATASSGLAVNFTASGNCTVTGTLVHLTGAGSCTITAHQPGDTTTWNAAPDVPQSFTINKRLATWTTNPNSKTYGDADPSPVTTGSGSNFVPTDNVTASYSRAAGESVAGNPYHITATLNAAAGVLDNYIVTNAGADFTINKRLATWTTNPNSKTYGDADPSPVTTGSGSNFVDPVTASYGRAAGESVAGNPYHITATLSAAAGVLDNYIVTNAGADFTINKRLATWTTNPNSKTYGDADPSPLTTGSGSNFVDPVTASYGRAAGESVAGNPYHITAILSAAAGVLDNYIVTNAGADFTINPRSITIAPVAGQQKTYGDPDPPLTFTVGGSGLAFSDTIATVFSGSLGRAIGENVGDYAITQGNLSANSNYTISSFTAGVTFHIGPASLTITPDGGKSKTYGDVFSAFTGNVIGLKFSDAVTVTYASTGAPAAANVGTYNITVSSYTFTTGTASNYTITANAAMNGLTVNPAPLSITPDGGKSKVLGSVFTAFTGSILGLKNSDAVTVTYASAGAPAAAGVGSYDITVASYNFTAGTATNYLITLNSAHNGLTVLYSTGACLGSPGHQILQPINADGSSVSKQGSTVPAKFRVCDANGNSVGTPGVVSTFYLVQIIGGTTSSPNETVDSTTPDTAFRWSATDQQWIFNINTKSLAKNQTYVYRITLNDGSTIEFMFGLR